AVDLEPDHVSAYALGIEPGTKMGAKVRRGELPMPDDDDAAAKYEMADDVLTRAGLSWYEVSNFSRTPDQACRHNLAYWRGADWWGIGPGAHSHVGGVRWWNVKHPRAYAHRLEQGQSPGQGREVLSPEARELERVMLGVRLVEGLELAPGTGRVPEDRREAVAGLIAEGLVDLPAAREGRIRLTRRGRLLADTVVRALTA
ncbi:MAG TPA: hypothetical protein VKZ83_02330, partial [Phototrophicaceae bacterium]|nr:hypothetical protein [Phototrophicaceae bacterium]